MGKLGFSNYIPALVMVERSFGTKDRWKAAMWEGMFKAHKPKDSGKTAAGTKIPFCTRHVVHLHFPNRQFKISGMSGDFLGIKD